LPDPAQVLKVVPLHPKGQITAALSRGADVVVTAGAGSGKTRTLVARYLVLLAEGLDPRQVVAITFTEKAAREMRNRVRSALIILAATAVSADDRVFWASLEARMDAARIGTIHSLCLEILRTHPAEAGLDPRFAVIDEGLAATLKADAIEAGMAWAADQERFAPIFKAWDVPTLQRILDTLMARRLDLDASEHPSSLLNVAPIVCQSLGDFMLDPEAAGAIAVMKHLQSAGSLVTDAGEKLATQIEALLADWDKAASAIANGNALEACQSLFTARREHMLLSLGYKDSRAKDALAALRSAFDRELSPWLGGDASSDQPPDPESEALFSQTIPLLVELYRRTVEEYQSALLARGALDFDDLEAGALRLLEIPSVRRDWRAQVAAILVDEYQDTNARQQRILDALCDGRPGVLFVVGDARQSIYRFRGADVTIFRALEREVARRGGHNIGLNLTFRMHRPLLTALEGLLRPIMDAAARNGMPDFSVPYGELWADRETPGGMTQPPYVEFILAAGENAAEGRKAAAEALARRLLKLKAEGQITEWEQVALLFRASTAFPFYEEAFAAAGIPYLTVAGSGFYDRPEIRDLLNLLRAVADPANDQAVAGALRSPLLGLSDAALYRLRFAGGDKQPLRKSLAENLEILDEADHHLAARALEILEELEPLADRTSVANLLKRVVDRTFAMAVLAGAGGRLWHNVDKLLEDARTSGLVKVSAFFEYLDAIREVSAREGEAPVEAGGALRLMTIHKAKGLEFDFTVLADATRMPRVGGEAIYLHSRLGPAARLSGDLPQPLAYRLARWWDYQQDRAEEQRLLYVAATRAKEKLLINGYIDPNHQPQGWLGELLSAGKIDPSAALDKPGEMHFYDLPDGSQVGLWLAPADWEFSPPAPAAHTWPDSTGKPLFHPITPPAPVQMSSSELPVEFPPSWLDLIPDELDRAVQRCVLSALHRWWFPPAPGLEALLRSVAAEAELRAQAEQDRAVLRAITLLERLRASPSGTVMDTARRWTGLHYTGTADTKAEGIIDILYQGEDGWCLAAFWTPPLHTSEQRAGVVAYCRSILRQQARMVRPLVGKKLLLAVCFLDWRGEVALEIL